jgi:hypothetical protein
MICQVFRTLARCAINTTSHIEGWHSTLKVVQQNYSYVAAAPASYAQPLQVNQTICPARNPSFIATTGNFSVWETEDDCPKAGLARVRAAHSCGRSISNKEPQERCGRAAKHESLLGSEQCPREGLADA